MRQISDGGDMPFSVAPTGMVVGFNLVLSIGISLLFSLMPALQMMKPGMNEALRQQSSSTLGGAQQFRRTAIAVQIGLSVLLLSGAGLFVLDALPRPKGAEHGYVDGSSGGVGNFTDDGWICGERRTGSTGSCTQYIEWITRSASGGGDDRSGAGG